MRAVVHTERGSFVSKNSTGTEEEQKSLMKLFELAAQSRLTHLQLDTDVGVVFISGKLLETAVIEFGEDIAFN